MSSKRMMKTVDVRFPKGWGRVMWGASTFYWGEARSERFKPGLWGDVVSVKFAPDIETGAGTWEVHFPTCGGFLALLVTEPEG